MCVQFWEPVILAWQQGNPLLWIGDIIQKLKNKNSVLIRDGKKKIAPAKSASNK